MSLFSANRYFGLAVVVVGALLTGLADFAHAGVMPVAGGYRVSYSMNVSPATPTGTAIENVYFFEWNEANFVVSNPVTINGSGRTDISHVLGFLPTSAFAIGYIDGDPNAAPGSFESKRHLYTLVDTGYYDFLLANHNGQIFSQIFGIVEQVVAEWIFEAAVMNDSGALANLTSFVKDNVVGKEPAFDPAGDFQILHWSSPGPGGGSIPEPGTATLLILGLAGAGIIFRQRTSSPIAIPGQRL